MTTNAIVVGSAAYQSAAAEYLDQLGWAVAKTELVAVTRYGQEIPLLRVFHPALSIVGESISAVPREDAESAWWFRLSDGTYMAPCTDLPLAVSEIFRALEPIFRVVERQRSET
ncbi:hypothetical protein ACFVH6_20220 [Spirillospora sp. NPDC127200]